MDGPMVNGYCDEEQEKEFCEAKNVIEPLWTWTPTEAPSNLVYYNSDYFSEWRNSLLQCFLKGGRMHWLPLDQNGQEVKGEYRFFCADIIRIRDVLKTPDGRIFLCSSNKEIHKPFSYPGDDKLIEVTNLNKEKNYKFDFSVNAKMKTFNIKSKTFFPKGSLAIVDHIGNELIAQSIKSKTQALTCKWWPTKKGYYFIKIKLDNGTNIQKRFIYEPDMQEI